MSFEGNVGADCPHFAKSFLKCKSKRTQNWEEAKLLVNGAWDNKTYVLTADDFAGVSFTHGHWFQPKSSCIIGKHLLK